MERKLKEGDRDLPKDMLHYDIVCINGMLNFMESKLKVFFKDYRKNSRIKIDNTQLINSTKQEIQDFFDFIYLDEPLLEEYICKMLCVQIYSNLEHFLYRVCKLIANQKIIKKYIDNSRGCKFKAYVDLLDDSFINLYYDETYIELDKWRIIRNSLVHDNGLLTKYKMKLVKDIVKIDDTCAPYQYSFVISTKHIRNYLFLVKDYMELIYEDLYFL